METPKAVPSHMKTSMVRSGACHNQRARPGASQGVPASLGPEPRQAVQTCSTEQQEQRRTAGLGQQDSRMRSDSSWKMASGRGGGVVGRGMVFAVPQPSYWQYTVPNISLVRKQLTEVMRFVTAGLGLLLSSSLGSSYLLNTTES